jgi:hypothetical protein
MYLLYIDESGDPHGWSAQKNFVLGALAVHEGQVYRISKLLDDIQNHYYPDRAVPIGFHATEVRGGRGIFRELRPNIREQLMTEIYQCITNSKFPTLIAFATVMDASFAKNPDQVLHDTFQDVCQRFNMFLVRQFNFGQPNKGLLIIDAAHQERYRQLVADFKRVGTDYQGPLTNLIDIPYFARGHDTRMVQLADFCAYAVFRYYEDNDSNYFDYVLPKFDRRDPQHPPDGLKHFTRDFATCGCVACTWRRDEREDF